MNVGHASSDDHATLSSNFFHMTQWDTVPNGGVAEDRSWNRLRTVSQGITPVRRKVIPEHYDAIRKQVTQPWPENREYKSYETHKDTPSWGGNEVVYNTNA